MKKVVVMTTGGTIAMKYDPVTQGLIPAVSGDDLIEAVPALREIAEVEVVEFSNVPSGHITPQMMFDLAKMADRYAEREDVSGIVVTHGTDTLEETAYFLDTLDIPNKPIVLTGAMRSSNELGSDGVYNYLSALRVAADVKAADKGVLLVMNDEIHAAKFVTKTHTTNLSTFQTPTHGPLGLVTKRNILFFNQTEKRTRFHLDRIEGTVPIIKAYADMDSVLLDSLSPDKISGLVIEALGAGNLPPSILPSLQRLTKEIPVVLVSRCFNGIAEPVYAYQGGGVQLEKDGILFVKELNSQKARIKLLIALNAGLTGQDLADYIQG